MRIYRTERLAPQLYRKMLASLYRDDPCFRDSLSSLYELITSPKGSFHSRCKQMCVAVMDDDGDLHAFCLLNCADSMPDILQVGFFEMRQGRDDLFSLLLDAIEQQASEWNSTHIVAGMNGHVNYGLGYLTDNFDHVPCFGSSYNPEWYPDLFRRNGFNEERLVSYRYTIAEMPMAKTQPLLARLEKKFTFRTADFSRLDSEIQLYTDLNNRCFSGHPLYFERKPDEDYELFYPFRWFLRNENFLLAEYEGKPVAFVLWYPNFHELIGSGERLGLKALLKFRLGLGKITRLKIAEIGVLPEFQGSGVMAGLFHLCFRLAGKRFDVCESGWILDSNEQSKNICLRWNPTAASGYSVFVKEVK